VEFYKWHLYQWPIYGTTLFDTSWNGQRGMSLLWIKYHFVFGNPVDCSQLPICPDIGKLTTSYTIFCQITCSIYNIFTHYRPDRDIPGPIFRIFLANKTSEDVGLLFGVPYGSVLGPKNYSMYTTIIKRYNMKYHCHADDTQVYMTLKPCDKWDDISS